MSGGNISNLLQDEEFDNLAGKLPRDIVNKIMSFWSPVYPFLEDVKTFYRELDMARIAFAHQMLEVGFIFEPSPWVFVEHVSELDDDLCAPAGLWFEECDTRDYRNRAGRIRHLLYQMWEMDCNPVFPNKKYHWKNGIMRGALDDWVRED